jgi:hypothetical protein
MKKNKLKITVKSRDIESSVTIHEDANIHEMMSAIHSLILAQGYTEKTIQAGYETILDTLYPSYVKPAF